jgi:hypothetical protein
MKPSIWGHALGVGLAAKMRGVPQRQNQKPLYEGDAAGCKPHVYISREGREKSFFLTSSFIG